VRVGMPPSCRARLGVFGVAAVRRGRDHVVMTARIFISYRASDGRDKATALARDLGATFGDDAVFLDKDDLRGGGRWAAEVGQALKGRPVMLLLVTPALLAAGEGGALRIADPADPVRHEFDAARAAGAHIVPVLGDGVDALPSADVLGAPWVLLHDLTWRRLRAYDWASDVERLRADLRALGVAEATAAPAQADSRRRRLGGLVALGVAVAAVAGGAWWWLGTGDAGAAEARVAGRWQGALPGLGDVRLVATPAGAGRVTLVSEPIHIAAQPGWADYRAFWRQRFGAELDTIVLRGAGSVHADPAQPLRVDIGFALHAAGRDDDASKIDGGNLSATLGPRGRRLEGELWLNSRQKGEAVRLQRR
jgi:hypothetical protein